MKKQDIYGFLKENGLLDYGSTFTGDEIRGLIGIEIPRTATKQEFDEIALLELGTIDYLRNKLLNEGKYLSQSNGNYAVLLPSENEKVVLNYMAQATRKLNRGLKLNRNTPVEVSTISHQDEARMHMKEHAIKSEVEKIKTAKSEGYHEE